MIDPSTFLTALYVQADDFFQRQSAEGSRVARTGRRASLSPSEVVTLGLFGQWFGFGGERGFWRWGSRHLRGAFPRLPDRAQFNRLLRAQRALLEAFGVHLAQVLGAAQSTHEAIDLTAAPTREAKRRGAGWLPGQADIGHSNRLGFFEGFQVLASVSAQGVVSGWCFAPASTKEQPLAEDFLSVRHAGTSQERAALPSAGVSAASGSYAADKGFEGKARHARWQAELGVQMLCAPKRARGQKEHPWPKPLRRWLASIRQIVETVFDKLHHAFGLRRERPHCLQGFAARLAARVGLHNFCILLNRQFGRPNLAFADLVDW